MGWLVGDGGLRCARSLALVVSGVLYLWRCWVSKWVGWGRSVVGGLSGERKGVSALLIEPESPSPLPNWTSPGIVTRKKGHQPLDLLVSIFPRRDL